MPRDASGNYTLPAGNPVVSGTVIETNWANPTMSDIGNEITGSLSRAGEGGMLAPLKTVDGTITLPGYSFVSFPQSGIYAVSATDLRMATQAADIMRWTGATAQLWKSTPAVWQNVATVDDIVGQFSGDSPDLNDTDVALIVVGPGNAPNDDPHIEFGEREIQCKNDETSAGSLLINSLGGVVRVGSQNAAVATGVELFYNNVLTSRLVSEASGGLQVSQTATGSGLERVLTVSDTSALDGFVVQSGQQAATWLSDTFADAITFRGKYVSIDIDLTVVTGTGDDLSCAISLPVGVRPLVQQSFILTDVEYSDAGLSTIKCSIQADGRVDVIRPSGSADLLGRHTGSITYRIA